MPTQIGPTIVYAPSPPDHYPIPEMEALRPYEIYHSPFFATFEVRNEKDIDLLFPVMNIFRRRCWKFEADINFDIGKASFYWGE